MFGNRKRKPQEEESLVPHGLIWHATEEPTPEEDQKNQERLGHTLQYAQGIERARQQQSASKPEPGPEAIAQVPSSVSAPIPWWRVQQPEPKPDRPISKPALLPLSAYVSTEPMEPEAPPVAKIPASRIQPMEIRPAHVQPAQVQPIQVQPIITNSKIQAPEILKPQLYKAEVSNIAPAVPKINFTRETLPRGASRLRSFGQAAWLATVSLGGKVHERGRQVSQSIEFRQAMIRAGKQGQVLFRKGITRSGGYARTVGTVLSEVGRRGIARMQRMPAKVNSISTTATTDVIRPANTDPSTPSRIRLLLTASAWQAKVIGAQGVAEWKLKRDRIATDSRLWISMTLSAIVAVIALAIVSAVPHYAAKSLPSRALHTKSSVNANVASPAAPAPHAEKAVPRKTVSAPSQQQKTASAKPATAPKPRRAADDDYVAPDTYKYYGNVSKASR